MTVDDWVLEAIERAGPDGATLRDIQRDIDERRDEELAIDTIEAALEQLARQGRIEASRHRWRRTRRTTKADALRALFGEVDEAPTSDDASSESPAPDATPADAAADPAESEPNPNDPSAADPRTSGDR